MSALDPFGGVQFNLMVSQQEEGLEAADDFRELDVTYLYMYLYLDKDDNIGS